jgi:hypothetical protein
MTRLGASLAFELPIFDKVGAQGLGPNQIMSSLERGNTPTVAARLEQLRAKVPFALDPLNLEGTYTIPPPPEDFNPNTASATDLIKNGILWKRPTPHDDPALIRTWREVFGENWHPANRIVPVLEPRVGRTHTARPRAKVTNGIYSTANWAGGVLLGSWTGVVGSWVVPTISVPPEPPDVFGNWELSTWTGIDGGDLADPSASNDVLQAGVTQSITPAGTMSCFPWFEWFAPSYLGSPKYLSETQISNFPVKPGDAIYCSVMYLNQIAGYIAFANRSTGQTCAMILLAPTSASVAGNSIEWIVETPLVATVLAALPQFTPVSFTSAFGCSTAGPIGQPSHGGNVANITNTSGKVFTSTNLLAYNVVVHFQG